MANTESNGDFRTPHAVLLPNADSGRLIVAIAVLMTANRSAILGRRSRQRSRHHQPLGMAVDWAHQRMFSVMMPLDPLPDYDS